MSESRTQKIGYWEVTSIGVGGMVGGGIFAVLGLSVDLTHGGAPMAFLLAGIVALVTAYSYARLSVTYPSQGGTVAFLDQAFGPGLLTGSANILLLISYIVMLSLYAYAFGSYGASLLPSSYQIVGKHVLISASVIGITGLNLLSAKLIGEVEDWIVLIKLLILVLFIAAGIWGIEGARLAPSAWSPTLSVVAGGMIIFLAYEGFELIANSAQDVRAPVKTLPRAFYSAVGFVIALYVLIAVVTVGTLPVAKIVAAKDYALAEAARPFLGQTGFLLIAMAAMLSTASAINATVYGSARLSYIIAKDGELPEILETKVWNEPIGGLLITAGATLLIANWVNLSSISTMGSAGFLLIFAAVNGANALLSKETQSQRWLSLIGVGLCLVALASLLWETANRSLPELGIPFAMIALAFLIEAIFRMTTKRTIKTSPKTVSSPREEGERIGKSQHERITMAETPIATEDAQKTSVDELFDHLQSSPKGLSGDQAQKRLDHYGRNALTEHKRNPIVKFLSYFWGPIPWMIEVAAILSAVVQDWIDLTIILGLLLFNALIGFWEERKADNALEALKGQLALKARALRDGQWQEIAAEELVPGDIVRLHLGDIVPADAKLIKGDYLSVDQSALTGESLPVEMQSGDLAYSGSVIKQGEMVALVVATGSDTYFARTAQLVESAGAVSHFQKAVMHVGDFLIIIAIGLSVILIGVELYRGQTVIDLIEFVLILVVASIPVAMPAVLSVTMALGALVLSKRKAIVSRLQAIEEMAGIDILCSDKTGTLTQNKLTLGDPVTARARDAQKVILAGALASEREDSDAIDKAVLAGLSDKDRLKDYSQLEFVPFDPVSKRTEATIKDAQGHVFKVTKGAPQVIIEMSRMDESSRTKMNEQVDDLAAKGYRTLGVASTGGVLAGGGEGENSESSPDILPLMSHGYHRLKARAEHLLDDLTHPDSEADSAHHQEPESADHDLSGEGDTWQFLGILPLLDPPREDSADTIAKAKDHGIKVKMITGDDVAIGRQIAGQLGMGKNIQPAEQLFKGQDTDHLNAQAIDRIEQADGFGRVFPEHKYGIVKALQSRGRLVGMTGDGVNDAPALKQAEVGIAVSGATEAARSAAALVLTQPGLSTIITAVEEARRIFERMMSYTIYRISMTINIMVFVVLAMIFFDIYPLTAIMIILLALLDDIPIMTIAYDNTYLDPKPVRWNMQRVLSISSILGFLAVIETFGLMYIGREILKIDPIHLQTMIFLQLVVGGHLLLFLTRKKHAFWRSPYPSWQLFWAIMATQAFAVLMCGFGWLVPALPWRLIGLVWLYNLAWMIVQDVVKLGVYNLIEGRARHKRQFVATLNKPLHPHQAVQALRGAQGARLARRLVRTMPLLQGVMVGSVIAAVGGLAVVVLAVLGLADNAPLFMASAAAIVLGAVLLFEGGSIIAVYSRLLTQIGQDTLGATALGMSIDLLAGITGIVLGGLAIVKLIPMILLPIAVIVLGLVLTLSIGTTLRVNSLAIAGSGDHKTAHAMVSIAVGVQMLIGVCGIALGILALLGIKPLFLILIALTAFGGSSLLSGVAISARMLDMSRLEPVQKEALAG